MIVVSSNETNILSIIKNVFVTTCVIMNYHSYTGLENVHFILSLLLITLLRKEKFSLLISLLIGFSIKRYRRECLT